MEKDIENIKKIVEDFVEKYNCLIEVETASYGWTSNGRLAEAKARIKIES